MFSENNYLQKMSKTFDVFTKELSGKANLFLDDGKFEEAQSFIKLAKEIPTKFVSAFKKGKSEFFPFFFLKFSIFCLISHWDHFE